MREFPRQDTMPGEESRPFEQESGADMPEQESHPVYNGPSAAEIEQRYDPDLKFAKEGNEHARAEAILGKEVPSWLGGSTDKGKDDAKKPSAPSSSNGPGRWSGPRSDEQKDAARDWLMGKDQQS